MPWGQCGVDNLICDDVLHPNNRGHLPTGEITLAEALKRAGEARWGGITGALSKWHLGLVLPRKETPLCMLLHRTTDVLKAKEASLLDRHWLRRIVVVVVVVVGGGGRRWNTWHV